MSFGKFFLSFLPLFCFIHGVVFIGDIQRFNTSLFEAQQVIENTVPFFTDFNGDGILDFFFSSRQLTFLGILDSDMNIVTSSIVDLGFPARTVTHNSLTELGDVNQDTFPDYLMSYAFIENNAFQYRLAVISVRPDLSTFFLQQNFQSNSYFDLWSTEVYPNDLFNDGRLDVVGAQSGPLDGGQQRNIAFVSINSDGMIFQPPNPTRTLPNEASLFRTDSDDVNAVAVAGDANADGFADLFVTTNTGIHLFFLGSDGDLLSFRSFSPDIAPDAFSALGWAIRLVQDLDADGNRDVIFFNPFANDNSGFPVVVFLNGDLSVNKTQQVPLTIELLDEFLPERTRPPLFSISLQALPNSNSGLPRVAVSQIEEESFSFHVMTLSFCGDRILSGFERCDDGNELSGDGCSEFCFIEDGFECAVVDDISVCSPICGDGLVISAFEECDDGNLLAGDGCSAQCETESSSSSSVTVVAVVTPIAVLACCLCFLIGGIAAAVFFLKKRNDDEVQAQQIELAERLGISQLQNVSFGKLLGTGEFGPTFKGTWKDIDVAIKSIKGQNLEQFTHELTVSEKLRHPNVLIFYGISIHGKENFLIYEYMNKGSLLNHLRRNAELTLVQLYQFCMKIASGMEYLHSNDIIHRDLACRNILASSDSLGEYTVKISDFGLSRKSENYYKTNSKAIPVRWSAPEVIALGKSTKAGDVWSYGVVVWEIYSRGGIPFGGFSDKDIYEEVSKGLRLSPPDDTPKKIEVLFSQVWRPEPENRPSFSDIYQTLSDASDDEILQTNQKSIRKPTGFAFSPDMIRLDLAKVAKENKNLQEQINKLKAQNLNAQNSQLPDNLAIYNNETMYN